MTEIATIYWFGRWWTFVFSENTAIFFFRPYSHFALFWPYSGFNIQTLFTFYYSEQVNIPHITVYYSDPVYIWLIWPCLLQEEVIQLILSFLDLLSLCRVARTCRLVYYKKFQILNKWPVLRNNSWVTISGWLLTWTMNRLITFYLTWTFRLIGEVIV